MLNECKCMCNLSVGGSRLLVNAAFRIFIFRLASIYFVSQFAMQAALQGSPLLLRTTSFGLSASIVEEKIYIFMYLFIIFVIFFVWWWARTNDQQSGAIPPNRDFYIIETRVNITQFSKIYGLRWANPTKLSFFTPPKTRARAL